MTPLVTFDRATLGYGRRVVLSDISFEIPDGDFLGLVGPNGAGKTTILRALLGSLEPLGGTVTRSPTLRFGYVPQRDQVDYNFPLNARALVGQPNVLVLDEPTNGMDLVATTQILGLVRELHENDGLTVLMVS